MLLQLADQAAHEQLSPALDERDLCFADEDGFHAALWLRARFGQDPEPVRRGIVHRPVRRTVGAVKKWVKTPWRLKGENLA
jgi:hypothetical protein